VHHAVVRVLARLREEGGRPPKPRTDLDDVPLRTRGVGEEVEHEASLHRHIPGDRVEPAQQLGERGRVVCREGLRALQSLDTQAGKLGYPMDRALERPPRTRLQLLPHDRSNRLAHIDMMA
jgi:hypothetical protein